MRFTIFQESRKGAREVNQDRIAYTYSRETLLLVVADGMGGHPVSYTHLTLPTN